MLVVRALNWGFKKGELSCTQREGIITCIPKGDKRRDLMKNWRPISLLNVVYKIGSAAIANRIKTMLPELINVNNVEYKISQYADDTEFLLAGDRESFETCITVIDNFGRKSGLYMNAGKTSAVWLGSKRNSVVKIYATPRNGMEPTKI